MEHVVISGTGLFTPPHTISNAELVESFNQYVELNNQQHAKAIADGERSALLPSSSEFIEKASGIKQRYVMDKAGILDPQRMKPNFPARSNEQPSLQCDIAYAAAEEALARAGKRPQDIDAIYVACSNMERPYPAMAIELQARLGCSGYAFDLNVACSSAAFGYQTAANAIQAGAARCVLVVNPEICSAHLNFRDRDSHFIFGDACTASLLERKTDCQSEHAFEIISSKLYTQFSNNIRNNMGFLWRTRPHPELAADAADKLFVQSGRKVFKEVTQAVSQLIADHLHEQQLEATQLARLWLHQANASMNQLIVNRLLPNQSSNSALAPIILDRYANTSSAGSVIAFHLYQDDLKSGDLAILSAFGAGYSIGNLILQKC